MKLYNIIAINTGTGQQVYNENLPWTNEPNDEEIKEFIRFIRPFLKFDQILSTYLRELNENEV